ncbi:hypothetical protein FOH24_13835 [Acetobacter tropicalis]|uniref:Uncharacterized protein n=1 Tax=Acetobacter tropicalis TaxID=104102 RepID=A0A094ZEE1_9PROT|nr:hypothetical protein [Acetobacter tropicalis]KAA8387350.1 hypothetical protein FOH24_13835 [Acetobacter tropicalis]KAA8387537.1 hypothetical protein FOH22_09460 [Acetobacter tropicalis]KGB20996.1 hypothetical protein AtDm6_3361 [Acetobacter tropicalis]MBC9010111.1 hypothetical protein [Acetobacter tropicalis]MDO8170954.1 hypothetical protein [Acetobacter tropicalis]
MHVAAIKTATIEAIERNGGPFALEHSSAIRVGKSQISDYQNRNKPQVVPVDVAIELDRLAQAPLILAAMARAEGYDLIPSNLKAHGYVPRDLAKYAKSTSEVLQVGLDSIADGEVSVAEAHEILDQINKSRIISDHIGAAMHKIIRDNKPHIISRSSNSGAV